MKQFLAKHNTVESKKKGLKKLEDRQEELRKSLLRGRTHGDIFRGDPKMNKEYGENKQKITDWKKETTQLESERKSLGEAYQACKEKEKQEELERAGVPAATAKAAAQMPAAPVHTHWTKK